MSGNLHFTSQGAIRPGYNASELTNIQNCVFALFYIKIYYIYYII